MIKAGGGPVIQCPQCHQENPPQANFCLACGVRLTLSCQACGTELPTGARFCLACGQPVQAPDTVQRRPTAPVAYTPKHLAERILTSRSALEGERKQVTVLFCDLTNSTALAERLGPEAMHTVLNRFFELALAEVHRYEGTINQFLGDGFMALFGAPVAHEDHARRAVLAALGLQEKLHQEGVDAGSLSGGTEHAPPLSVRMGLNTGLVVVGSIGDNLRMDYTAVGDTTNLAARLQQLAEPGAILLSETTARLVRSEVRLEALEPAYVKGKTEPVVASRVLGPRPRRSPLAGLEERALSPFVGRERELTTLHELLVQIEAGQGQVVGLVGEAGVGKSRLLFEFRQCLSDRRVTYLEGRCLSYGSATPYLPLAAWTTGWIEATRGEWQVGLDTCQRSLERAPDPLNTGVTLGFMGCAYLEKGDSLDAIAALEQAVQYMQRFRFRQLQGRFTTWLGEAY